MAAEILHEEGVSGDEFNSMELEAGSSRADILDGISSGGEANGELGRANEILTRVELDLACFSEKLVNLSVLTMHVATRESDFESFISEKDNMQVESMEKAAEFDLLSGILDSEVNELDKFMEHLETYIISSHETISSFKHLGETFFKMEEKLLDSEESLKQSREQVSEIKMQAADFHRSLSRLYGNKNGNDENDVNVSEADQSSTNNAKIKMQTIEQQRHILRMLEKSLAREIDLEKKYAESRETEEKLKPQVLSLEQGIISMEEEVMDVSERLFEAQNAATVFMGISNELLGRLQVVQFNLNTSVHRETELRSKLEESTEKLKAKETALRKLESSDTKLNDFLMAQVEILKSQLSEVENNCILADSEAFTMRENLERQLKESELNLSNTKASLDECRKQRDALCSQFNTLENGNADLKVKLFEAEKRADEAEKRADKAEYHCKLLRDTNMEVNDANVELNEKLELLEKQLKESEIQLIGAVASAEASQEKQNMYHSTVKDMENLIEDLKLKVSKAENRADSAEDKCIILSETNADLKEELCFLRDRLGFLEASLNRAEEMKMASARDIGIRTKLIANLLMQLGIERERLHQQISGLAKENKVLVVKLKQTDKEYSIFGSHENKANLEDFLFSKQDSTAASAKETKEDITKSSASGSEPDKATESVGESEVRPADTTSEYDTVRTIDVRALSFKHIFLALLVLLTSMAAAYYFQKHKDTFY